MNSIHLKNINFGYEKDYLVFQDFSLKLSKQDNRGKVYAIMGSSGSGKSTFMKLLLGIIKPISGTIQVEPVNPVFSYVPQEAVLFEHLSIRDNARYFQFAGAFKKRFNEELFQDLVKSLGLEEVINSKKSVLALSGGQKQRLSLLRALSIEPDYLLLDEPCNGLDAEVKRSFLIKLREVTQRYGFTLLYITHHKLEAQLIADEVVYLVQEKQSGKVKRAAVGSVLEFMEHPPVLDAAYIFRFPDVKILPMKPDAIGNMVITKINEEPTENWLLDDNQIELNASEGFPFKIVSISPVYTVLRNLESGVEWMVQSKLMKDAELNYIIKVSVNDNVLKYKL